MTIVRDGNFGVPHIYGSTRAGTMFGLGYVGAEDRLFVMDALRNAGRGGCPRSPAARPATARRTTRSGARAPTPRPTFSASSTWATTCTAPRAPPSRTT